MLVNDLFLSVKIGVLFAVILLGFNYILRYIEYCVINVLV